MRFRIIFAILCFMLTIPIFSCAKPKTVLEDTRPDSLIHYSQRDTVDNLADYVVYLNKGDKIPIKMTMDSDVFGISDDVIHLILKQKLYFKINLPDDANKKEMTKEEKQVFLRDVRIYLSPDARQWAPHTDLKSVESLFGLKGGQLSLGMQYDTSQGLGIFLKVKTNPKRKQG